MTQGRILVIQPRPNHERTVGFPVLLGCLVEEALQFAIDAARRKNMQSRELDALKRSVEALSFDALVEKAVQFFSCESKKEQVEAILRKGVGKRTGGERRFDQLFGQLDVCLRGPIRNCLEFVSNCIEESRDSVGAFGVEKDWILREISENGSPRFDQVVESAEIVLGCASEKRKCLQALLMRALRTPESGWPYLGLQLKALRRSSDTPLASCTFDRFAIGSSSGCASDWTSCSDCTSLSTTPFGDVSLDTKLDGLAGWIRDLTSPAQNVYQNAWYSAKLTDEFSDLKALFSRAPSSPDSMRTMWERIEQLGWKITPAYRDAVIRYLQEPGTQLPDWHPDGLLYIDEAMLRLMRRGSKVYADQLDKYNHKDFEGAWAKILNENLRQLAGSIRKGTLYEEAAINNFKVLGTEVFNRGVEKTEHSKESEFLMALTNIWQKQWVEEVCVLMKDLSKWLAAHRHEIGRRIVVGCLADRVALRHKPTLNEREKEVVAFVSRFTKLGVLFSCKGSEIIIQSLQPMRYSSPLPKSVGIYPVRDFLKSQARTRVTHTLLLHWARPRHKF